MHLPDPDVIVLGLSADRHHMNGIFIYCNPSRIAPITDGTSNTILYGEKANGMFTAADSLCFDWWGDAVSRRYALHDPVSDQCLQEGPAASRTNTMTRGRERIELPSRRRQLRFRRRASPDRKTSSRLLNRGYSRQEAGSEMQHTS